MEYKERENIIRKHESRDRPMMQRIYLVLIKSIGALNS